MLTPKEAVTLLMREGTVIGHDIIHQAFLGAHPDSLIAYGFSNESAKENNEKDIAYILDISEKFELQSFVEAPNEIITHRAENWKWVRI